MGKLVIFKKKNLFSFLGHHSREQHPDPSHHPAGGVAVVRGVRQLPGNFF